MKTIITCTSILFLLCACAHEQKAPTTSKPEVLAPAVVIQSFQKAYPAAEHVKWTAVDNNIRVDFMENSLEREVLFAKNGATLMAEMEINVDDLPAVIHQAIERDFSGMAIAEAEKMLKGGETFYEIDLGKETGSLEVIYSEDGTVVSRMEEGEADEENEEEEEPEEM